MALSDLALCSRALLKIGANTITSFDEGTVEAEVASNLYPSTRDGLLSAYPWSFATGQTYLPKLGNAPMADYDYVFQLPADFLRVLSAGVTGRGIAIEYRIEDRRIHTNTDIVVLNYIFRPDETAMPAFFDLALIVRLSAEFCIPITENTSRAEALFKQAENEIRHAKLIDEQQKMREQAGV